MPLPDDHERTDAEQTSQVQRALAAFMQAELSSPIHAIAGYVELLNEEAAGNGLQSYEADLGKIDAARRRIGELIERVIDGTGAAPDPSTTTQSGKLRHDLRTPIAAILGFGELLAEQALDDGHESFAETLNALLDAARRLLTQVDVLTESIRSGRAPASAMLPPERQQRETAEAIWTVLIPPPMDIDVALAGHILVVDDDMSNVDLLTRRLTRDGHTVTGLTSGRDALEWTDSHAADVVLLDLIMPGLNGIEVLRTLREREATRLTPILIISGLDEADGAIRCIEAGADDYLSKPVDAILLRARIKSALERKQLRDREIAITQRLRAEYERAEGLLRSMLPVSVVDRLRGGEAAIADHFDSATILFCDLVGFTATAARLAPGQTLDLLNTIFSAFDQLARSHGVEKIKTIGDAYMAAGGLPEAGEGHAAAVVAMAMQMPSVVERISRDGGHPLTVRIGVDTGPVAAGIIGTDKFLYDVWGDAVNTASRMEHHGTPGRVHITEATRTALGSLYEYEALAAVGIKGKGEMQTYLIR